MIRTPSEIESKHRAACKCHAVCATCVKVAYGWMDVTSEALGVPIRRVVTDGTAVFGLKVPPCFGTLISLELHGYLSAGAAGGGKDIDLTSYYGNPDDDEDMDEHSAVDNASTYTIPASGVYWRMDVSGVFASLAVGDVCGLKVVHNTIGCTVDYVGLRLEYCPC